MEKTAYLPSPPVTNKYDIIQGNGEKNYAVNSKDN
jgi:hypothetical protein